MAYKEGHKGGLLRRAYQERHIGGLTIGPQRGLTKRGAKQGLPKGAHRRAYKEGHKGGLLRRAQK